MWSARDVWAQPPGAAEPVVLGVSFDIAAGEWLAVAGPNGCGKSTLALAAAGLWPLARGRIEVAGVALESTAASRARLGIAAVLQEPASQLFEHTVADEIVFASRNLGVDDARLAGRLSEWGARFGLVEWLDRDPRTLSAGWQQRVLLAGALASEPAVLVVDEGAAHMDAASRALVLAELRAATRRGLCVLWVTQDAGEVAAADRVLRLVAGGIVTGATAASQAPLERSKLDASRGPLAPRVNVTRVRVDPPVESHGRLIRIAEPVEWELAPGHPLALVGANGSGKTVALEAIAGLTASPQVTITEAGPWPHPPVLAAQFPELQVFGETVAEELCFGAVARGENAGRALELASQLIAELGLEQELMSRSTWSLSAGERRLIQVAAALLTPASRVVIDEPTCGLDRQRAERLSLVLARIGAFVPVIVATQDPELPSRLGARERRLGE